MKVFLTGATGFVGTAVAQELKQAGHEVLGMAHSDAGMAKLAAAGIAAHRGELTDHASLIAGAAQCDGVIHTAFIHDFSRFAENVEVDRKAVAAMVGALEGSGKRFVLTSGTALIAGPEPALETTAASLEHRGAAEAIVVEASGRGLRGSVVRLSPSVHGAGDHGFVPMIIAQARKAGFSAYVGDGANRWPGVWRFDAARLYRLAFEKAGPGARFHAAGEEGAPMRDIAAAIGEGLGVPARSLTPEEAGAHFGWFARFIGLDNPTSSALTRKTLGWTPEGPDLLTDIRTAGYFN